jgi:2-keto-4-pentenoate hydratase/2-oxohepta-3-ene-1,7-dioic acid hydratase in catechol pathway
MNSFSFNGRVVTPGKIVCVGKNYDDHIAEMGGAPRPHAPVIFIKPNSALAFNPKELVIPKSLGFVHHEVELCCLVGATMKDAAPDAAKKCIAAYAVGLDLTLRDMQAEAKKAGLPWTLSKGFDGSAVIGEFVSAEDVPASQEFDISLSINGTIRQNSNTRHMIFAPWEILSYASHFMTIEEGDILMCGTPSGVGPLEDGDRIEATLSGAPVLVVEIKR